MQFDLGTFYISSNELWQTRPPEQKTPSITQLTGRDTSGEGHEAAINIFIYTFIVTKKKHLNNKFK